ncbi:Hypothetical predicted protein, partial [Marmota monax]
DTAALAATEADTAADSWRLPGETAFTVAVAAADAATAASATAADPLPAANNHHHYRCYCDLE